MGNAEPAEGRASLLEQPEIEYPIEYESDKSSVGRHLSGTHPTRDEVCYNGAQPGAEVKDVPETPDSTEGLERNNENPASTEPNDSTHNPTTGGRQRRDLLFGTDESPIRCIATTEVVDGPKEENTEYCSVRCSMKSLRSAGGYSKEDHQLESCYEMPRTHRHRSSEDDGKRLTFDMDGSGDEAETVLVQGLSRDRTIPNKEPRKDEVPAKSPSSAPNPVPETSSLDNEEYIQSTQPQHILKPPKKWEDEVPSSVRENLSTRQQKDPEMGRIIQLRLNQTKALSNEDLELEPEVTEINALVDVVYEKSDCKKIAEFYDGLIEIIRDRMTVAYAEVREPLRKSAERNKRFYDLKIRHKQPKYQTGDWILYFNLRRIQGKQRKWIRQYAGPFLVTRVPSRLTVTIQRSPKTKLFTVHIDKVKLYTGISPASWTDGLDSATQPNPDEDRKVSSELAGPASSVDIESPTSPNAELEVENEETPRRRRPKRTAGRPRHCYVLV